MQSKMIFALILALAASTSDSRASGLDPRLVELQGVAHISSALLQLEGVEMGSEERSLDPSADTFLSFYESPDVPLEKRLRGTVCYFNSSYLCFFGEKLTLVLFYRDPLAGFDVGRFSRDLVDTFERRILKPKETALKANLYFAFIRDNEAITVDTAVMR
ncbi:hypothetical protein GW915_07975 [bacterium]|nr:hypothetical protein [bacterium]